MCCCPFKEDNLFAYRRFKTDPFVNNIIYTFDGSRLILIRYAAFKFCNGRSISVITTGTRAREENVYIYHRVVKIELTWKVLDRTYI